MLEIALIGNPNCGKTTLFNTLTGSHQKTGNWTGVTVEQKVGYYKKDKSIKIIDLPGLYSLNANSIDEKVVYKYLKETPPDAIINIIDGTNLERNLYLTCELAHLNIPVVIAVNMYDQLLKNNVMLNLKAFEKIFGVPVIPISAIKKANIETLINIAKTNKKSLIEPNLSDFKANSIVEKRYKFLESIISLLITQKNIKSEIVTEKIDKIILNRFFALPIFFIILLIIYYISIKIGGQIGERIAQSFYNLEYNTKLNLHKLNTHPIIIDLICNGVLSGIGAIFSLLPQVLILFALLCILEQSGYASRIAFIFDRIFCFLGLSGKSIVPMLVACGCTVSGINATRTIENTNQRRATIFLTPFMPCGAKMAVFGYFSYVLFDGNAFIATSMYFVSIICIAIFGIILKKLNLLGADDSSFILEMPLLRLPAIKDVLYVLIEKIKDFTLKVGTTIFILTIILWILQNFGKCGYVNGNIELSFIYSIGNLIKFLFVPLGFGNWQSSISFLCGMFAKEGIAETLQIICQSPKTLFFNEYSAYAFMVFVLLSPPCVASLITAKKELNNKKLFLLMILFQFFSAYLVALLINLMGILIKYNLGLLLFLFVVIMIMIYLLIKIMLKRKEIKRCQKSM